jgi:hypothetical protein
VVCVSVTWIHRLRHYLRSAHRFSALSMEGDDPRVLLIGHGWIASLAETSAYQLVTARSLDTPAGGMILFSSR